MTAEETRGAGARPDYIVIGAGSAGSVIANRLTADPRRTVLLIEAGGGHRHPFVMAPAGLMYILANPRFDWGYHTEADPTRGGKTEHWPRGRVLGGSSSTNGMIFVRGQAEDYDDWARAGATGWAFDDVEPYFRRMERTALGEDGVRGRNGPLSIGESWRTPGATETFITACGELQIPHNPDYNGRRQEGAGFVQATIRRGMRHSSAAAYLDPVRRRPNLTIVKNARATRIITRDGAAIGVEYQRNGRTEKAYCGREVILSGGAIGSPHLLMLSGIGPAAQLQDKGVTVVHDLPGVGANLRDHPNFLQQRTVNIPTLNTQTGGLKMAGHMIRWLLTRSGPAASAGAHGLAFIRSRPDLDRPDIQLHFSALSYQFKDGVVSLAEEDGVTIIANVSHPKSQGRVRLRSADPQDDPLIEPRMFDVEEDLDILVRGAKLADRLFATSAFSAITTQDAATDGWDDEAWHDVVRSNAGVTYHPVGTCRIGEDGMAVVDPRLRVRGVPGLRVADASVFPALVSGNTNAAALMVGERAADLIIADEARFSK